MCNYYVAYYYNYYYSTTYTYYNYNYLCAGQYCLFNDECAYDCCHGATCNVSYCHNVKVWTWIGIIFFFFMLFACVGAKCRQRIRHQRMM